VEIDGIIGAIIIGAILGVVGRAIAPGKQDIPIWLTILVGIAAAFLGSLIASAIGVAETRGIDWIELIIQVVAAVIGVIAVAGIYSGKSRSNTT
jgi:uncharacterized membrane protein YeaQ/YmgE (transglycosylase-associated protein family)